MVPCSHSILLVDRDRVQALQKLGGGSVGDVMCLYLLKPEIYIMRKNIFM